jgi:hypothetical protein
MRWLIALGAITLAIWTVTLIFFSWSVIHNLHI